MGLKYHVGTKVPLKPVAAPYEFSGRRQQKARTRDALVSATRELITQGVTPTVEEAATTARISRTTAYRYFPNQRTLLLAAHPEIQLESLLPEDAPTDPQARLNLVMQAFTRITIDWEPQLRTSLRVALEPGQPDQALLRQGRAIRWIEDALAPLRDTRPDLDVHRLSVVIRSATGIESLIWLTDIAGLSRDDSAEVMRWSARAMLQAALEDTTT